MAKVLDRYENLFSIVEDLIAERRRDFVMIEVGTGSGRRGADLCEYWRDQTDQHFNYIGFDLFEDMDEETAAKEMPGGRRLPQTKSNAQLNLKRVGAGGSLIKGTTRETLPTFADAMRGSICPDLVFMDGGRTPETIESDWNAIKEMIASKSYVVFNTYYVNDETVGCKLLIDGLRNNGKYVVTFLPPIEKDGERPITMVLVRHAKPKAK